MLKGLISQLRTSLRLLVFVNVPLAFVALILADIWLPGHSVEEQVLFVGVPLGLFFIGVRIATPLLISVYLRRVAHKARQMEIDGVERRAALSPLMKAGALSASLAAAVLLMSPMFIIALPIYWWLDMPWALIDGLCTAGATFLSGLAIAIVTICISLGDTAWRNRGTLGRGLSRRIERTSILGLRRLAALF